MHRQRVLSALVLLPGFLLLVQLGSPFHFSLLVSVAIGLAAWEFARLCPGGLDAGLRLLLLAGALAWHAALLSGVGAAALPPALGAVALAWSLRGGNLRAGALGAAWTALGLGYVGGLMGCASLLRAVPDGRQLILYVTFVTWAGDIGAYYVGSRWGRRPLAIRVSPKKSWEGLWGGLAASGLVAAIGSTWLWPRLAWPTALPLGVFLGVVGLVGDLAESALKRAADVKDSGGLIPGHGGVLDRLDSLMFAVAALYALVWLGWV
jgi:phosphatidate cytidylyltransferase